MIIEHFLTSEIGTELWSIKRQGQVWPASGTMGYNARQTRRIAITITIAGNRGFDVLDCVTAVCGSSMRRGRLLQWRIHMTICDKTRSVGQDRCDP